MIVLDDIIREAATAATGLLEAAVVLIDSIIDEWANPGKFVEEARRIACTNHREDVWQEEKCPIYPTSHTGVEVDRDACRIQGSRSETKWRNFKEDCIRSAMSFVEIGRRIVAEFQRAAHVIIASGINAAASVAESLSDAVGRAVEGGEPIMTLWEQYQWSLDHCDCVARQLDIMDAYERMLKEGW